MNIKALVFALLAVSGSAFAGLDQLTISSSLRGDYVIGLIAHDQRDFVLHEGYPENQLGGYIGGMFRTRRATYTNSDKPVADELADGLRQFFTNPQWAGAAALSSSAKDSVAEVEKRISRAGLKRTVLVTINDLWTESYRNTSVSYKFTISVRDAKAKELARAEYTGTHDTSVWGDDAAAEIFSRLMTDSLSRPEFIAALRDR
ncbi:MAG: hypothetical protein HGA71_07020 [Azonexaceae bacterium]|nr:hypothetical protein [Azonexaceae bacterium]